MTAADCRTAAVVQCAARVTREGLTDADAIEAYRKGYLLGYRDCAERLYDSSSTKTWDQAESKIIVEHVEGILDGLTDLDHIWEKDG